MVTEQLQLITGRTREQAIGMHRGKASEAYRDATHIIEMNAEDMTRLGVAEGATVRVTSPAGSVELPARAGDLPAGLVFIPLGAAANSLVDVDTAGTGMPGFKGQRVEVTAV